MFHESLTMLAYALMDPVSAMNSQRVYRERQHKDGYINYRTGPYLDETIPHRSQLTTSAPWYAWQNWEVYRMTKDRTFLEEMYESSAALLPVLRAEQGCGRRRTVRVGRRSGAGICARCPVAVWDEVGWPAEFEALDANAMLVMEAKALVADGCGTRDVAVKRGDWQKDADSVRRRINEDVLGRGDRVLLPGGQEGQ